MKIVLFNGPPYSGKTTAASILSEILRTKGWAIHRDAFAAPMKHFIATLLGERYEHIKKDDPHPALLGGTPRAFLVALSEGWMKPLYGVDAFGRTLANRVIQLDLAPTFVIVDDSGFKEEYQALVSTFGSNSVRIVGIHRPGYSFKGDSRAYLPEPHHILNNDTDEYNLRFNIEAIANLLIAGDD